MTSAWTIEELDEQIAITKEAIKNATRAQSYTTNSGASGHSVSRNKLADLHEQLRYFQAEKAELQGRGGIAVTPGRAAR